jgi:hypothetical protein
MGVRDVIKNWNVFVDGKGYAGQADEVNPPKLTLKMEEFRAGGMNLPKELDMGMEKMEADFSLISFDRLVLAKFGVAVGQSFPFVFRAALESDDGTTTAVAEYMRGRIKEIDPGTRKAGEKATLKVTLAVDYYKLDHGGITVQEIDVDNMVHIVNGVDVLAAQRAALGN